MLMGVSSPCFPLFCGDEQGELNVVFNSLPFWVSAIYFPVKQREKKKKVLARRRGKGKAKRGKKGTK